MPSDLPENPIPELLEMAKIEKLAREQEPRRNRLIRHAVEKGHSQGYLALLMGLDQTRIGQIVRSGS